MGGGGVKGAGIRCGFLCVYGGFFMESTFMVPYSLEKLTREGGLKVYCSLFFPLHSLYGENGISRSRVWTFSLRLQNF